MLNLQSATGPNQAAENQAAEREQAGFPENQIPKLPAFGLKKEPNQKLFDTIHSNPLAHYVYALIRTRTTKTVEELQRHFPLDASVIPFVNQVVNDLHVLGEFEIEDGKFIFKGDLPVFRPSNADLKVLYPNLLRKGALRILRDQELGSIAFKKESLSTYYFPDVPEIAARLKALNDYIAAELTALAAYETKNTSMAVRFVTYSNFVPTAEDFTT